MGILYLSTKFELDRFTNNEDLLLDIKRLDRHTQTETDTLFIYHIGSIKKVLMLVAILQTINSFFRNLKGLKLSNLPNVENIGLVAILLQEALPGCTIFGIEEERLDPNYEPQTEKQSSQNEDEASILPGFLKKLYRPSLPKGDTRYQVT